MKIYVIPCGWDKELVWKTVFKKGVDKVCLISAKKKKFNGHMDTITQKFNKEIKRELSRFTKVDTLQVNYVDMKDIAIRINQYVKDHPDAEFTFNISTGSHLLAATLLLVAFMNNIKVEYSFSDGWNPNLVKVIETGEDIHVGFSNIVELPTIPFKVKFSAKENRFLSVLQANRSIRVRDYVGNARGDLENRRRSEFNYLCKKLEKQGLIQIKNGGKSFTAVLTKFGEICVEN